jgi:hypothetical protein
MLDTVKAVISFLNTTISSSGFSLAYTDFALPSYTALSVSRMYLFSLLRSQDRRYNPSAWDDTTLFEYTGDKCRVFPEGCTLSLWLPIHKKAGHGCSGFT